MNITVFDMKGAAEFLSLSPRTLRANLSSIPHFTSPDGGKYLFRSDELLSWLERFRVKPVDLSAAHAIADALTTPRRRPPGTSTFSPPSVASKTRPSPTGSPASTIGAMVAREGARRGRRAVQ